MFAKEFDILYQVLVFFITINTIGAFITIFRKPRSIASIFAWMMTLVFIPGFGFLLYLFCGGELMGRLFISTRKNIKAELQKLIVPFRNIIYNIIKRLKPLNLIF